GSRPKPQRGRATSARLDAAGPLVHTHAAANTVAHPLAALAPSPPARAGGEGSLRLAPRSPLQPRERGVGRELAARAGSALLELDDALVEAARADDELVGQADQIHRGKF